jgi:hypothetical protein
MHVTGLRCGARLLATNENNEFANGDWRSVIGRVYQIARLFNATPQAQ